MSISAGSRTSSCHVIQRSRSRDAPAAHRLTASTRCCRSCTACSLTTLEPPASAAASIPLLASSIPIAPGRPSLTLDLMEEFRAFLADRLALSLINMGQIKPEGFIATESGAIEMTEATRKDVVAAYQRRKQETIVHAFLNERTTIGLLVHLQARLPARFIRGELDAYPPFLWK